MTSTTVSVYLRLIILLIYWYSFLMARRKAETRRR